LATLQIEKKTDEKNPKKKEEFWLWAYQLIKQDNLRNLTQEREKHVLVTTLGLAGELV